MLKGIKDMQNILVVMEKNSFLPMSMIEQLRELGYNACSAGLEMQELSKLKETYEVILLFMENGGEDKKKELQNEEAELNKLKTELITLKNNLFQKEQELSDLDKKLNDQKRYLNIKEESIEKLEERYNSMLVVEVPDTYKKSYARLISKTLIIIGVSVISIGILRKIKKV